MWYDMKKEGFVDLFITARPSSGKNSFAGIYDDALKVHIKAPPVDGAANKELVKFLSKSFKIAKGDIEFLSGESSKRKRIRVPLNEKVKEFIDGQ
ncbi:MAG: DUF167 domain-containing protein [Hydrogenimonas sp.]|nr:DUF167 domain-containing protein [Hydrogenimonas sp.]